MIRYNPCGRVCEMSRRAYSTPCRFFRDNDQVDTVRWMEAAPGAEDLDRENVIVSLDQEPDAWFDYPVGEVADEARTTTLAHAPAGTGTGHVCGTDEDFRDGGHFDEELPPVRYGAFGLPLCCHPPKRVRGGAGASGRMGITVAPLVVPGATCATAAAIVPGVWYSAHHSGAGEQFWRWPGPATFGANYRVTSVVTGSTGITSLFQGSCAFLLHTLWFSQPLTTGCLSGVVDEVVDAELILVIDGAGLGAFNYTFKLEQGTCP